MDEKRERGDSKDEVRSMSRREGEGGEGRSLAVGFRTLSIHVDTRVSTDGKGKGSGRNGTAAVKGEIHSCFSIPDYIFSCILELLELDWHSISTDEVLQRLAVSQKTGLEASQAKRRLQTNGKNAVTPPRSNLPRKLLEWLFGGFGSLLLVASIICFIAWFVTCHLNGT